MFPHSTRAAFDNANPLVTLVSSLKSRSARKEGTVDGVNDGLSADLTTTKETSVETFNGVLAALNTIKFEVDVALSVRI